MSIKIDYRMEFERCKKTIAVQGVLGGSGSATIIDKRLPVKHKKDFDSLQVALEEFLELADELVVREDKADRVAEIIRKCKGGVGMSTDGLEKEILRREIKYLQSFTPDVFFFADRVGYVQAWKNVRGFWLECKGVNGEYFTKKFDAYDMVNTCKTYFSALRTGYPLWEV